MSERVRYERTGAAVTRRARQTPPGARPSRTVDPARRGPGGPQRWMAAPDRIRLTGSLRKRPLKGPLLFAGSSEDRRLAGLGPLVLDPGEAALPPPRQKLERLRIPRPIGIVEQQIPARPHLFHCRLYGVDARDRWGFEEVDDDEI